MTNGTITFIIIMVVLAGVMVGLYFLGKKYPINATATIINNVIMGGIYFTPVSLKIYFRSFAYLYKVV